MGGGGLKGGCRVYGGLNGMMRGCRLVSFSATAFSGCLDFLRVHVDMPADVAVFVLVEHLLPLVERVVQGFAAGAFQEDLGAFAFGEARHLHGDGAELMHVFGQQGGDAVADVVLILSGFGLLWCIL